MTAHVFIVNDVTFSIHLLHRFAGTGTKDVSIIDFNGYSESCLHHAKENLLVKMMADVGRIKKGDRILFYAQSAGGQEGRFYGIFRATGPAFLDNDDKNQYLFDDLKKSLTFRVLFEPDEVYPEGVTEWEALDEIRGLDKPHQIIWSLVYRKLKANRGCTMITPYEEGRLCCLIRAGQRPLDYRNGSLYFDSGNRKIAVNADKQKLYEGSMERFSLMPRLLEKHRKNNQFEAHLQACIVGQLASQQGEIADILLRGIRSEWLGNEMGCGVGMQSIDIMVSYRDNGDCFIMPIELKSVCPEAGNVLQIQRYVDWIEQYYVPNHPSTIEPVLIARKCSEELPADFIDAVKEFNLNSGESCKNLRVVEFEIAGGDLRYTERSFSS